jgi:large subunit ribosomal protein L6
MVEGVEKGFEKELVMKGTGYKAQMEGTSVVLFAGYSHTVKIDTIPGVNLSVGGQNNTSVFVKGIDKQAVGQIAAQIRQVRLPEPYLGKGIAYKGEHIRRKEGKKAGKK